MIEENDENIQFTNIKNVSESIFGNIDENNIIEGPPELTLDEPVLDTLLRDLKGIWTKTKKVLRPNDSEEALKELRDWDLWGPLLFCLILSTTLSFTTNSKEPSDVFTMVFSLFWLGSGVVTINAKLLQGKVSFFQTLCILGYCLFPLVLASIVLTILYNFRPATLGKTFHLLFDISRILFVLGCWAWTNRAATVFISYSISKKRRLLAIYPAFLLYSAIAWLLIT